jgi:hypothetical protein
MRQGQTCLLQWQVPDVRLCCGTPHFRSFADTCQLKLHIAKPSSHALVAGFVNLTSLRLRGRGYAPSTYDIAWHVECGYGDTSYSLRSLHHLTAPASGGTRCACRAQCSTSCCLESTSLEHKGSADQRKLIL